MFPDAVDPCSYSMKKEAFLGKFGFGWEEKQAAWTVPRSLIQTPNAFSLAQPCIEIMDKRSSSGIN
jgi:hypothetical protein